MQTEDVGLLVGAVVGVRDVGRAGIRRRVEVERRGNEAVPQGEGNEGETKQGQHGGPCASGVCAPRVPSWPSSRPRSLRSSDERPPTGGELVRAPPSQLASLASRGGSALGRDDRGGETCVFWGVYEVDEVGAEVVCELGEERLGL